MSRKSKIYKGNNLQENSVAKPKQWACPEVDTQGFWNAFSA